VTAGDDSDEEHTPESGKMSRSSAHKLELLSIAEIKDVLATDESLQEEDLGELIAEIANHLHP
jgi:hypothetical protein